MPTRKQKVICDALVKTVDLIHDGLDVAMFTLRNQNESNGEPLGLTVAQIKSRCSQIYQRILTRRTYINDFVDLYGASNVASDLTACGYIVADVLDAVENIRSVIQYVANNLPGATTLQDCADLADYIEANHEVLVVYRRPWYLES